MLNKYLTLVFCLFLLPAITLAQRAQPGSFKLGFTVSPTFGWMEFQDPSSGYDPNGLRPAWSYGIIGDFGFTDNYFFGTGFTLTTMAANVRVTLPQGSERIEYKIQYIDIPATLKLKSTEGERMRFYGQFGPDLGIRVSSKHNFTQLNVEDDARLLRFGLLIGGGAEWKLRNSNLLTGLTYNNGFTKVFSNPDAKNHVVSLNLGIFF